MRWTDRQHALLAEMGIRLWPTESVEPAEPLMLAEPPVAPETPAARPVTSSPQPAESAVRPPAPSRPVPLAPASMPRPLAESLPVRVSVAEPGQTDPARSVSEMDWDELESTVAACRLCGLCEGRRQTVFGVGNRQAQWMLVGEAPGEQEDLRGEPFVGKAGQLLDNMLRAVGLTREVAEPQRQVYIANVLKCRPPQNRNPEPLEVQRCEPYLKRQVELVRPRLILAMGRFAVQSLLQTTEPIGRLRGKQHSYHGVPVVVTYHPAYLLRNPLDKARAWEDLCLARELMQAAG